MKLQVIKTLEAGIPRVEVITSDFTPDEQARITKFGSPSISINPKWTVHNGKVTQEIPVHALNNSFTFESENEADDFAQQVTNEIRSKMTELKNRNDAFSGLETYDI